MAPVRCQHLFKAKKEHTAMATLNFIKGTIRGKIGEFVGSSWKGKNYIKTFTKPGNPRTADQVAVRTVFYHTSQIAKGIYESVLKPYTFPRPKRITAYNRMIQINKAMFESKEWKPESLKIFEGELYNPGIDSITKSAGKVNITFSATGEQSDMAIAVIFDGATGGVYSGSLYRGDSNVEVTIPADVRTADLHAYLVFVREPVIGTDEKGQTSNTAYKKIA